MNNRDDLCLKNLKLNASFYFSEELLNSQTVWSFNVMYRNADSTKHSDAYKLKDNRFSKSYITNPKQTVHIVGMVLSWYL